MIFVDEEPDKAKEHFAMLKEDTARGRSVLCGHSHPYGNQHPANENSEAFAGTSGGHGFEQRPPGLVSVALAGNPTAGTKVDSSPCSMSHFETLILLHLAIEE
jgi:hypothetical protein